MIYYAGSWPFPLTGELDWGMWLVAGHTYRT